mmetsp:Transcript_27835/g.28082  ORF Transcript_27835/g.28082 Transcript_27835/m.28082 type:complete len:141 (-) Transcript_27835:233-655(-)
MLFISSALIVGLIVSVSGFSLKSGNSFRVSNRKGCGTRSLTCSMDILAGLSIAAALNTAPLQMNPITSFPIAATEVREGLYKDYTVEVDTTKKDDIRSTYKTAEQTEDSKDKYWAILGVLLFGSFVIPMVQYYWYVAEED